MVYLLLGDDEFAKEKRIEEIKYEVFSEPGLQEFNYENFSSKDLTVKKLQESLLRLPVQGCGRRLIVVRNLERAQPELKEFIIQYSRAPYSHATVILSAASSLDEDKAFKTAKGVLMEKFGLRRGKNAFDLGRALTRKEAKEALSILGELLLKGEKPERVIGGLRYHILKDTSSEVVRKKNLTALLNTEIEIKTGKLKPATALEKMIVRMCCLPSN